MPKADWKKNLTPGKRVKIERGLFAYLERTTGEINYGISYFFDGKHRREIVGTKLKVARARLEARRTEIREGRYAPPEQKPAPTFDEFKDEYLKHVGEDTRVDLAFTVFQDIAEPDRLDSITTRMVDRFKTKRAESCAESTVNRDLAVIKHALNVAVEWGYIKDNPAAKVRLFKIEDKVRRVLTESEEKKLLAAAADHLKPILVVGINTGLRRGELLRLEWGHVDFDQNHLVVEHSKSKRIRYVPMNAIVRTLLENMRGIAGPVFRYGPNAVGDFKTAFRGAVRRAEIPHCSPHCMRHTFATRLVLAGVDLMTVKELLGHASVKTTERYAHPNPPHKQAAVDKLTVFENQTSTQLAHDEVVELKGNTVTR
jgi:integrase